MSQGARGEWRTDRVALPNDIKLALQGSGAPVDGTSGTGAGVAGPGSFYIRTSNGAVYVNTNTKASPTWGILGTIGTLTSAHLLVGNGSNVATDVALSGDATLDNTGKLTVAPGLIQVATKSLTAANIKAMYTTPVEVLAAPAAGKVNIVHQVIVSMTYGSVQMTAGGVVSLVDHGTHNAVHTGGIAAALVQGAASFAYALGPLAAAAGTTRPTATAIDVENATQAFATGDSTMKITMWYSTVTP